VIPQRPLGASGLEVSVLALGSWRTYERLPREAGLALMKAAREVGIDFLDDARYDDESGEAPIPTGYSEVVFGELFRAAGWRRDEVVVSNKLWWEFWPGQSAAQELDASLGRMGFDYLDLVYSERPPEGLAIADVVEAASALIASGKARAWGVLNWSSGHIAEAARIAAERGAPAPCAAQLAYSLAARSPVEDAATASALERSGVSVVASEVLARGALTARGRTGRASEAETPRLRDAFALAEQLAQLANRLDASPVQLALAFPLLNPLVATALFGASRPEQVRENAGAVELLARLSDSELSELRALGSR
jgi:aryl-alcohol dehydrogenase-like predicted oxidoreductase